MTINELFDTLNRPGESKKSRIDALNKLKSKIDLNTLDYDYERAIKEGMTPDERGHWDNKYKRPSHITYGEDSIYSNPLQQGGQWKQLEKPLPTGEEWSFEPSLYQKLRIPKEQYQNYFNQVESGKGGAVLQYDEPKKMSLVDYIMNQRKK